MSEVNSIIDETQEEFLTKNNNFEDQNTTVIHAISAGFVFYSQPPNSDDWYFLLGMDDFNGKWSDFGGRRNEGESEIHCAVREMLEETMCVVRLSDNDYSNTSQTLEETIKYISTMLEQKNYTFRIGLDVPLRNMNNKYRSNDQHKSKQQQQQQQQNFLAVDQICPFNNFNLTSGQSLLSKKKRLRVCYVKHIQWQPNVPDIFAYKYKTLRHINQLKSVESKYQYIQTLPKSLQQHPGIVFEYKNKEVVNIYVPDEWLEKQQIAWWSLPRLQLILKNNGKHNKHIFRCGFLSTLGVIVDHFIHASFIKKQHNDAMRRKKNPFIYELENNISIQIFEAAINSIACDDKDEKTREIDKSLVTSHFETFHISF